MHHTLVWIKINYIAYMKYVFLVVLMIPTCLLAQQNEHGSIYFAEDYEKGDAVLLSTWGERGFDAQVG